MPSKIYRSASGKPVDMGQLLLKNENVRAVGNMGVNAKGDKINNTNKVIESKVRQVHKEYKKQVKNNVVDIPPQTNSTKTPTVEESIKDEIIEKVVGLDDEEDLLHEEQKQLHNQEIKETKSVKTKTTKKKPSSGLASAIAKAREVKQEKLQTDQEKAKSKKGVKKI